MQKKLCIESPDVFVALAAGHILGSNECQHQFQGNFFVIQTKHARISIPDIVQHGV
jgi:hypothetical protein